MGFLSVLPIYCVEFFPVKIRENPSKIAKPTTALIKQPEKCFEYD